MPLPPRRKGIYILPNLFTLAALFGGFYAVVMAMNGRFDSAAVGVFCAMVLDSLDGRVARMTNTQSAFGEQMDSLSDMVSFGAAPALIAYVWALKGLGTLGLDRGFRLLRLRRAAAGPLQRQYGTVDKRYFQGLPRPAAAALVTGFIWVMDDNGFKDAARVDWLLDGLRRHAVRGADHGDERAVLQLQGHADEEAVPFVVIVLIALGIAVVNIDPPIVLFAPSCLWRFGLRRVRLADASKASRPASSAPRRTSPTSAACIDRTCHACYSSRP